MGNRRTVPIPKYGEWEEYEPTPSAPQVNPVDTLLDDFLASDRDGISFKCESVRAALSLAGSLRTRTYNNRHPYMLSENERRRVQTHYPYYGKVLVNQSGDTVYIRRAENEE